MVSHVGTRQYVAESGAVLDFLDNKIHLKLTADDTGGAYALVEYEAIPGFEGPPAHIHERTSEYFFVLEGNLAVTFGSRQHVIGPGDGMLVPPGAIHTFAGYGGDPVRFLTMLSPGGFEGFLVEAANLAANDQWPPDPATIMEILTRYDMVVPQG